MAPAAYRIAEVFLFDTCTLKCGYCHFAETGKVLKSAELQPFRDPAYIDRVTGFFNKRTSDTAKWHLMLTGGEPLLMPNFQRFSEALFAKGNRISLYTALVIDQNHPSFRFLLEHGSPEIEYLMASFHPEAELQEDAYWERVRLLVSAGHQIVLRFVAHPKRLDQLDRLSEKCREMDICFYPTTLFSRNYPDAYTETEKAKLTSHFSSLSQIAQLEGGIDTTTTKCHAGSRMIAVHLPTGEIWPCISVHSPVLGNIYEDRLATFDGPISCPEAGMACICDIHTQQDIVIGAEDHSVFEKQKLGFVAPLGTEAQALLLRERKLPFSQRSDKKFGDVQSEEILFYSKTYVKEQFEKLPDASAINTYGRPDVFVAALNPKAASVKSSQDQTLATKTEEELAKMRQELQTSQATLAAIERSVGWRLLNRWRTLRDGLLPSYSLRRKLYESMLGRESKSVD